MTHFSFVTELGICYTESVSKFDFGAVENPKFETLSVYVGLFLNQAF